MQTNPDQIGALSAFQELVERDLLTVVFEHTPDQIFVLDAATLAFVSANAAGRAALQTNMAKLRTMQAGGIFRHLSLARLDRICTQVKRRSGQSASLTIATGVGTGQHLRITLRFVPSERDSIVVFVSNLTAKYEMAELVNRSLRNAIEALSDGFVLYDASDRLVVCNEQYRKLYARSAAAMTPGTRFADILRFGLRNGQYPDAIGREDEWLRDRLAAHEQPTRMIEQQLDDGRWLRIDERLTDDGGRVGLRIDITEIKEQQALLDRQANTDDLTGLLNRRGLAERIEVLRNSLRADQSMVAVKIDLDRFKAINDSRGHAAGDFVLRHCAERLATCPLRPVASARIGADEFMLILRTRRDEATLAGMMQAMIAEVSRPIDYHGENLAVGASIGCAVLQSGTDSAVQNMISGADIALTSAKQSGGNHAVMFRPEMRTAALRDNKLAEEMILGLERGEFEPFFQPQIDARTGNVTGFEALIRWRKPVDGLVPAFQFLEIAQRAGLTEALDNVVMDKACQAVRQLMDWGMKRPRISINMSIVQISDPSIVARLERHMKTHGITAENLRVELLESTLLEKNSTQIVQNVHNLIAAGFPIELDDFGTGHAAIATLRKFAVSRIKIDRSLVQNIDRDAELQVITAAIINLARRLGIGVLAEGVETSPEQTTLLQMGCNRAQGYLHGRPMPLDQLRGYLHERKLVA